MGSRLDFREGSSSEFLAGKSKEGDSRKIFFPPREHKVERMGKLGDVEAEVSGRWNVNIDTSSSGDKLGAYEKHDWKRGP